MDFFFSPNTFLGVGKYKLFRKKIEDILGDAYTQNSNFTMTLLLFIFLNPTYSLLDRITYSHHNGMTQQKRNKRRLLEIEDSETRASQSYSKFLFLLFSLTHNQVKLLRRHELTPLPSPLIVLLIKLKETSTYMVDEFLRCTGAYILLY